jgi:hypothetical protein
MDLQAAKMIGAGIAAIALGALFLRGRTRERGPDIPAAMRPGPADAAVVARLADGWNCPRPADLEVGLAALEAVGADVGKVVRDFDLTLVSKFQRNQFARPVPDAMGDIVARDVEINKLPAMTKERADITRCTYPLWVNIAAGGSAPVTM